MQTRSYIAVGALLLAPLACRDDTDSFTAPSPSAPQAAVTPATALSFWQLSAGGDFSCGVTTDNRLYCWGINNLGQLGQGTNIGPEVCNDYDCSTRPLVVAGGLLLKNVTAGGDHGCGLTTAYKAYCWGNNWYGQLGIGTKTGPERCYGVACSTRPVLVLGGLDFRQVSAGVFHTCGVTTANRVYCWGYNYYGGLGDGTTTDRLRPIAVLGGLLFRSVSAGGDHTCGITTDDKAYCWGDNRYGQLGDSTAKKMRLRPVRVVGGRLFRQLEAGGTHTCGVTTGNRAYCWGNGRVGQLGNGKTYLSFWPRAVAGGLYFRRVTTGNYFTCGETPIDLANCWGDNNNDQLGNDDPYSGSRSKPVPVAGGLYFKQVDAGGDHACGKTQAGAVYCWGSNLYGQIGDGTVANRAKPTAVVGPL